MAAISGGSIRMPIPRKGHSAEASVTWPVTGQVELCDQELAGGVVEHPVAGRRALAALDNESQGRHGDAGARQGRCVGRGDGQPFDRRRPVAVVGVAADELPQRV
jgi:hypothetical protein